VIEKLPNGRYKFTSKDLFDLVEGSYNSIRHRVTKLSKERAIREVGKISSTNLKIYMSDVNPLVLFKLETFPENNAPMYELSEISGFFNNPFNLKNAVDKRWRDDLY
jgi:hypothetical protein